MEFAARRLFLFQIQQFPKDCLTNLYHVLSRFGDSLPNEPNFTEDPRNSEELQKVTSFLRQSPSRHTSRCGQVWAAGRIRHDSARQFARIGSCEDRGKRSATIRSPSSFASSQVVDCKSRPEGRSDRLHFNGRAPNISGCRPAYGLFP